MHEGAILEEVDAWPILGVRTVGSLVTSPCRIKGANRQLKYTLTLSTWGFQIHVSWTIMTYVVPWLLVGYLLVPI